MSFPFPPSLPEPGEPLRLLAVHAHPDDESSKGAATMARYVQEGIEVLVVSCTGGERGDVLNPALAEDEAVLADILGTRRAEMAKAAEILGVAHEWLGFEDSGFPSPDEDGNVPPLPAGCFADLPLETVSAPLVEITRRFRPHVITTYDENGGYPHPDHIRCHEVSMEAFTKAGDASAYPEAGEAWQPSKLYYHQTFHKARVVAMHEAIVAMGQESPYEEWLKNWEDKPEHADIITTQVNAAEWFPIRDAALIAHATQIDPTGRWFLVPMEVQQATWPTEDYQLAQSLVDTTLPEDDLFAGLRAPIGAKIDA